MKTIIKTLEKTLEKLKIKIEVREDYFLEKTEKWQESEKGTEYEDKTLLTEEQADNLQSVIDELEELW